jgi:hypothetical protein
VRTRGGDRATLVERARRERRHDDTAERAAKGRARRTPAHAPDAPAEPARSRGD